MRLAYAAVLLAVAAAGAGAYYIYFFQPAVPSQVTSEVSTFGECAAAGNPVMESYPRQCRSSDGRLFVEEVAAASSEAVESETYGAKYDALRSELDAASQSGGMTPESFEAIGARIAELESVGYDPAKTAGLREALSTIGVGGSPSESSAAAASQQAQEAGASGVVRWQYMDGEWTPSGEPPACPEPFVAQAPVDLGLVSSILYPGQVRGGDFKPHGGFRTDGASGPIEVRAPFDGYLSSGAKFYDGFGVHYMFEVQHPCGVMYRLGHLSAVPPEIEAAFEGFPERDFGDSRTEQLEPVFLGAGEVVATDIQHQAGFDWGVYDLREENEASQDPGFREAHADEPYQAYHSVCWFGMLPAEQEAKVRGLPAADGKEGKNSDYC